MSLDLFLLDKVFQPASTYIFKRTGIVNYTIARWFLLGATLFLFCSAGLGMSQIIQGVKNSSFVRVILPFIMCSLVIRELKTTVRLENQWKDGSHKLPPNFRDSSQKGGEIEFVIFGRKLSMWLLFAMLCFEVAHIFQQDERPLMIFLHVLITIVWLGCEVVGLYFLSCLPPPPGSTKEQEFELASTVA